MVRKISFQVKSYLFHVHEMFKNSGSGVEVNLHHLHCLPVRALIPSIPNYLASPTILHYQPACHYNALQCIVYIS
jgi:hypothetical protein